MFKVLNVQINFLIVQFSSRNEQIYVICHTLNWTSYEGLLLFLTKYKKFISQQNLQINNII